MFKRLTLVAWILVAVMVSRPVLADEPSDIAALATAHMNQAFATVRQNPTLNQNWLDISRRLVDVWLNEKMLARRLVGSEHWSRLPESMKLAIEAETKRTMQRYILESLQNWDEHPVNVVQKTLGQRRGYVDLEIGRVLNALTVPVRVELFNHENEWKIVDFTVQGIGYSAMKSGQFQSKLKEDPSGGTFLALIREKNDEFFKDLNAFAQN